MTVSVPPPAMQRTNGSVMQRAKGTGRIAVKPRQSKTALDTLYQEGAARIRMPKTHDGTVEAVLINTAGGLTGGDRLVWEATAGANTSLTLTTQACEKIYRASDGHAEVATALRAEAGAHLSWLPQEAILFERSALRRSLSVDLDPTSSFIGVESVVLGRQAMGETLAHASFQDRWRIRVGGALVHAEALRLGPDIARATGNRAQLDRNRGFATLLAIGPAAPSGSETVKTLLADIAGLSFGVAAFASGHSPKLLVRLAATDGLTLRRGLVKALCVLTPQATLPKVWHI